MMKTRRLLCLLLALSLMLGLAAGAQAEGSLFFVAVNDTIPVTLNAQPVTSGGVTYVPYTAFDARPGNVVSAYNTQEQTFVLFTKDSRLVFNLATGEVTDENQNASTQTVLFRSGLLYLPLVFCASHFGLKVSMLESRDGYPVLRFTTGSEVYDDALFIEKAENLIAFRSAQQAGGSSVPQDNPSQPDTPAPSEDDMPAEDAEPAIVYLAFANAETMVDSAEALADYQLRGTFFLTAAEIEAQPALVRELYAAGHVLGLRVPDGAEDAEMALTQGNEALNAVLGCKTLLALLPQETEIDGYRIVSAARASAGTAAVLAAPQMPHLLLCSGSAQALLAELYGANASVRLLRETTELP